MSNPIIIPPLAKFTGGDCREIRKRWWIHKRPLVARAGVTHLGLIRFERGTPPPGWLGKPAVYDALLDLVLEKSRYATARIEAAIKEHRGG